MEGRSPDPEFLVVGHVSKAHGTKGELLIWPLTDRPEEVFGVGRRVLAGDEEGEAGEAPRALVVEASRPYRRGLLAKFEGVEGRSEAELLASRYLLVPAGELSEPPAGGFLYHELLGLEVETTEGERVGRVREVFETEPAHLLEVKGVGKVHLIPFTDRIVKEVDLDAGRLVIEPPPGLLEL